MRFVENKDGYLETAPDTQDTQDKGFTTSWTIILIGMGGIVLCLFVLYFIWNYIKIKKRIIFS
jgi:hypothetical protein